MKHLQGRSQMTTHEFMDFLREYMNSEYPLVLNTNQKMIKGLHDLMSALQISKPVIIGASDGGALAQLYALQYSDHVSGLVLLTTLTIDSDLKQSH